MRELRQVRRGRACLASPGVEVDRLSPLACCASPNRTTRCEPPVRHACRLRRSSGARYWRRTKPRDACSEQGLRRVSGARAQIGGHAPRRNPPGACAPASRATDGQKHPLQSRPRRPTAPWQGSRLPPVIRHLAQGTGAAQTAPHARNQAGSKPPSGAMAQRRTTPHGQSALPARGQAATPLAASTAATKPE